MAWRSGAWQPGVMDERARRAEREAALDGSASARVRLAHAHRRSGRWADVLAATAGVPQADALGVRAEALLRTDQLELAAATAAEARALDPEAIGHDVAHELALALLASVDADASVGPADGAGRRLARLTALGRAAALGPGAAQALAPVAREGDAFERAQAARIPALAAELLDDRSALVRFVAQRTATGVDAAALQTLATCSPDEPPRTRLFSAHGPDFDFGLFVAFQASGEARFACCDVELFRAVDRLLGGPVRRLGFSREGYGLGMPSGAAVGDLEEKVALLDATGVLPFPLRLVGLQPYDPLAALDVDSIDDRQLCAWFVHDLTWHPARHFGAGPDAPLYAQVAAALGPEREPDRAALAALLERARERYTPLGLRALELFVQEEGNGSRAARRARSAEKASRLNDPARG